MRGIKYITLLVTLLFSVTMRGQYDPDNPIEPGYYYTLTLTASPEEGGHFYYDSKRQVASGTQVYVETYANTGYVFKCWKENGKVISTDSYFTYTMPNKNVELIAEFEYSPSSPEEPALNQYSKITVLASPEEAGSFNIYNKSEYKVGTTIDIDAYSNTGYQFEKWTENDVTISTSSWLTYEVKEGNHTLVAHYVYNPYDPEEPSRPEEKNGIYGFSINGERGSNVYYPVFMHNSNDVTGTSVDIQFPNGFKVHKDELLCSSRVTDQQSKIEELGNNTYRISLTGKTPFTGTNGKIFDVPVTIPDTAIIGNNYKVILSNGEIHTSDSVYKNIPVRNGYIYIKKTLQDYTMNINLAKGWSWISSSFDDARYIYLKDFIEPIESSVERIIGYYSEVIRDPQNGLTGNLRMLEPTEGYLIQTNGKINHSWNGNAFLPEDITIVLKKGWNWIGYIPVVERSVTEALKGLTPSEGDVIKDHDNFATFTDGKWTGTLTTMHPGTGYMYCSADANSFKYPSNKTPITVNNERYGNGMSCPWNLDCNAYPFNMSVIGEVFADDMQVPDDRYTVGAFVGDECRGIGKYVDSRLFMTVYGHEGKNEEVTFRAFDNILDKEFAISESAVFGNELLGSINKPFRMTVTGTTGIVNEKATDEYKVFVNQDEDVLYIAGSLEMINKISVISCAGIVMNEISNYDKSGINISSLSNGTYLLVINTNDGVIVKKFMKIN